MEIFYFANKNDLREQYPTFYYKMLAYVEKVSADKHWYFKECYNPNYDGSHLSVIYQSFEKENKLLCIDVVKNGISYTFDSKLMPFNFIQTKKGRTKRYAP